MGQQTLKHVEDNFYSLTVHLDIIKVFTPTDAQVSFFKKGVLKFTLKQLRS